MDVRDREAERKRLVPAVSSVLDDGRLVELVLDHESRRTRFAYGRGREVEVVESVDVADGTQLVPVPARKNLLHHRVVLLPERPEPFESIASLTTQIETYIARYVDLTPEFTAIASAYVLLSWVYDAFNELPYLRFRGDYGSGKTRALLVIGSITYKPLFASGASTISPIFHSLDLFRGTLVIDESDFRMSDERAEMVKILNQGNVRGFPVLRSQATPQKTFDPRAFHVYGPKIVAMRRSFDDPALESRFITEEMGQRPLRRAIPLNLPDCYEDEARALRNRLLAYRFAMHGRVQIDPSAHQPELSPRTNQILAPLLAVVPDPALRRVIQDRMGDGERLIRDERSSSPEGKVLDVVLASLGNRDREFVPLAEITASFEERFGREYDRPITARYIGHLVRTRLRLHTWKRHGSFVVSTKEVEYLRELAGRYGVAWPDALSGQGDMGTLI